jgi:subfamily B ATP-binding cassette protein MsbA
MIRLKQNIALGKLDTDEEIIAALKIANAYEFVKELPKGIHTNIGDSETNCQVDKKNVCRFRAVLKTRQL